jgi:hypothetical protein
MEMVWSFAENLEKNNIIIIIVTLIIFLVRRTDSVIFVKDIRNTPSRSMFAIRFYANATFLQWKFSRIAIIFRRMRARSLVDAYFCELLYVQSRRLLHDISLGSHYCTLLLRSLHDDSTIAFSSITESICAIVGSGLLDDSSPLEKTHIEGWEGQGGNNSKVAIRVSLPRRRDTPR